MMAIINSYGFGIVPEIAGLLAGRYVAGAVIGMDAFTPDNPEAAGDGIRSKQAGGITHFIVYHTFHTPDELKKLREFFSRFDDEIYAFRLRFTPGTVAALSAGTADSTGYGKWLDAQDTGARSGDMGYEIVLDSAIPGDGAAAVWNDIHEPIELVPYRSDWPELFLQERDRIFAALDGIITGIEHIGSTAIAGMTAKPVIDILLTVPRLADGFSCIQPLRELGYAFIDYPQNLDRLFFRKGKPRDRHLHIVEEGSRSHLDHVNFRDALLADGRLRREYLELKQAALDEFRDRRALYGERKGAVIRKALGLCQTAGADARNR